MLFARTFLSSVLGFLVLGACGAVFAHADASSPPANRPNIIVILADDLGYGDLASYNDKGNETPNLSRLAREGVRLTDFHSSGAVCSPTRAGFLTGRYQQRSGIADVVSVYRWRNRHQGLQPDEITLAERLREAGYSTGIVGKWHLGYYPEYRASRHGFDSFRGFLSGSIDYITHVDPIGRMDWWHAESADPRQGYSTHLISHDAIEFVEAHKDRPFFLYISHAAPHTPYQGPGDDPIREVGNAHLREGVADISRAYAEMLDEMDRGIGQLIAALRRLELHEKTLVFFFSDNGANIRGSNRPYRGFKGSLWEGGHRVPAIAWWPGHLPAGAVRDQTSISLDLWPTILPLAGATTPADHVIDGVDLFASLQRDAPLPARNLFWSFEGFGAVRSGPWKLMLMRNGKRKLYNIEVDPAEQTDLAQRHPERVRTLKQAYDAWAQEVEKGARVQPERPKAPGPGEAESSPSLNRAPAPGC